MSTTQVRAAPPRSRSMRLSPPVRFLGLYAALLPIQFNVPLWGGLVVRTAASDLVLLALLATHLPRYVVNRRAWTPMHAAAFTVLPLSAIGVLLFGTPFSMAYLVGRLIAWLTLFLVYAAVTGWVRRPGDVRHIMQVFVASLGVLNLFATLLFFTGGQVRLQGFVPDPNAYGGLLLVALCFNLPTSLSAHPLFGRRWLAHAISFNLLFSMVLTSSRSAWIGVGFAFLVFLAYRPRLGLRVLVAVVVAGGLLALGPAKPMLEGIADLAFRAYSVDARFVVLDTAWEAITSSPIVGIGLGQFLERSDLIVHNTLIGVLTEMGLVGLAAIGGLFLLSGWWAFDAYRRSPRSFRPHVAGLAMAFVGMFGLSLGIDALYQRNWWLVMGLVAAVRSGLLDERGAPGVPPAG